MPRLRDYNAQPSPSNQPYRTVVLSEHVYESLCLRESYFIEHVPSLLRRILSTDTFYDILETESVVGVCMEVKSDEQAIHLNLTY